MCRLRIFAGAPIYHLLANVIFATVDLAYINLQPEYEFLSSTRFGQFQKFWKIRVVDIVLPSHPKEKILHGVEFLMFIASCTLDLTFLAALTAEIWTVSPNWGPEPLLGVNLEGLKWYYRILWVWFRIGH